MRSIEDLLSDLYEKLEEIDQEIHRVLIVYIPP